MGRRREDHASSTRHPSKCVHITLEDAMLPPDQVNRAAQRLAAAASSPATIIVFGSYARCDATDASDLDLQVVEDELPDQASE